MGWMSNITGSGLLKGTAAVGIAAGLIYTVRKIYIKGQSDKETLKNGSDNSQKYFNSKGAIGSLGLPDPSNANDYNADQYTIWDADNNTLNQTGLDIEKAIEKEVYATFYTDDAKILDALHGLKTKGDFAVLSDYWNNVVNPARNEKSTLLQKLSEVMYKNILEDNYAKAKTFLDALPDIYSA